MKLRYLIAIPILIALFYLTFPYIVNTSLSGPLPCSEEVISAFDQAIAEQRTDMCFDLQIANHIFSGDIRSGCHYKGYHVLARDNFPPSCVSIIAIISENVQICESLSEWKNPTPAYDANNNPILEDFVRDCQDRFNQVR